VRALSLDLRHRISDAIDADAMDTYANIAARFAVSLSSVERIARRKRERCDLTPGVSPGRTPIVSPDEHEAFRQLVASRTDWTLHTLAVTWQEQSGKAVSISTASRLLARIGFTFKKNAALPVSATTAKEPPSGTK
jgi:transposase